MTNWQNEIEMMREKEAYDSFVGKLMLVCFTLAGCAVLFLWWLP